MGTVTARARTEAREETLILLLLFLISCLFITPFRLQLQWPIDEGIFVYGAERIMHGEVLYRDFFAPFMPGAFFLLASLFQLFGLHVLVGRMGVIICNAIIVILVYLLARRLLGRWLSVLPAFMLTVMFYRADLAYPHRQFALMTSLLALVLISRDLGTEQRVPQATRRFWWLCAGLATGLTALFVLEMGLAVLLALLLFLLLDRYLRVPGDHPGPSVGPFYFLGVVILPLLILLSFHWQGAVAEMVYSTMIWPYTVSHASGEVLYGHPYTLATLIKSLLAADYILLALQSAMLLLILVMPFFAFMGSLYLLWLRHQWGYYGRYERLLLLYLITGLAQFGLVMQMPQIGTVLWVAPMSLILMTALLQPATARPVTAPNLWRLLLVICMAALFVDFGIGVLAQLPSSSVSTRRGTLLTHPDNVPYFRSLFGFIEGHVQPQHDVYFFPGAPMYYFLSATRNPSHFNTLFPDYNTPQQFEQAVADLERRRPHYVIWDTRTTGTVLESYLGKPVPPQNTMEQYLQKHYRPIRLIPARLLAVIGAVSEVLILERRDRQGDI